MARNLVVGAAAVAVLFANPGTNDAIWLSDLEFLLILLGWMVVVVAAAPGPLLILVALVTTTRRRVLIRPAIYGAAAGLFVVAWILARGSRDWLLAPYGFDELAVIVVVGAALVTPRPALHG